MLCDGSGADSHHAEARRRWTMSSAALSTLHAKQREQVWHRSSSADRARSYSTRDLFASYTFASGRKSENNSYTQ